MVLLYFSDIACFYFSSNFYTTVIQMWTHWPAHVLFSFACRLWNMLIPLFGPWANFFSSFLWPKEHYCREILHWLCDWVWDFNSHSLPNLRRSDSLKMSLLVAHLCCPVHQSSLRGQRFHWSLHVQSPVSLVNAKSTDLAAGILLGSIT